MIDLILTEHHDLLPIFHKSLRKGSGKTYSYWGIPSPPPMFFC